MDVMELLRLEGIDPEKRAVVSREELRIVLEALAAPSASLNEISARFSMAFSVPARFRGCCALVILLRDYLLTLPQRLAVYFILFDVYRKHPLGVNPFVPVFINALSPGAGVAPAERRFAQQLLLSSTTDEAIGQRVPAALAEDLAASTAALKTPDLSVIISEYEESVPAVPLLRQAERWPVVIDAAGAAARVKGRRAIALAMAADSARSGAGDAAAASRSSMGSQAAEAASSAPETPLSVDALPSLQPASVAASLRLPLVPGESVRAEGTEAGALSALTVAAALGRIASQEAANAASAGESRSGSAGPAGPRPSRSVTDPAADLRGGIALVPPALMAAAALDLPTPAAEGADTLFGLAGLAPVFARPPPPLVGSAAEELAWLDPVEMPPLLWEAGMGGSADAAKEVRALMTRALAETLHEGEVARIRALLDANPPAVFESGLSPANLPLLVQRNAIVAVQSLKLVRGSAQSEDFLSALVKMPMTLESMEVVNRIAADAGLPTHLLHVYISNCISLCDTLTDNHRQSRHVRLVCVFLQSLIRSRVLNVRDLFVEVKAFCISNSHIKEANNLFKLLRKSEEPGGAGDA
ncbi:hypothetical protein FNF31_02938 [Cafeteria roenbergensis]|nr:hypothetical protein FNF31_02938 [Cafeteria roenbergensis]